VNEFVLWYLQNAQGIDHERRAVCIYVCICICVCVCVCVCIYIYMYRYVNEVVLWRGVCLCMYMYIRVCMYVYLYICINMSMRLCSGTYEMRRVSTMSAVRYVFLYAYDIFVCIYV